MDDSRLSELISRTEQLISKLEQWLPEATLPIDWAQASAFRWTKSMGKGILKPIPHPHRISPDALLGIDQQKQRFEQNIQQFTAGLPANNVLLTGARGTGKSSLVKAMLHTYARKGLRLIELGKDDLVDLALVIEQVFERPEKFLIFCDDLSFEPEESSYKALKVALDGSISATPENVLIIATSNRRHLLPEYFSENLDTYRQGEEIHPGEAIEQKISLSERFGLWISFHAFDQEQYLQIVAHWLAAFHVPNNGSAEIRQAALQWALLRGSRSGRTAWQFARDWAGKAGLHHKA